VSAISNPDSKGGTAYLAPPIQSRLRSAQGSGGLGAGELGNAARRGVRGGAKPDAAPDTGEDFLAVADAAAATAAFGRQQNTEGGGLTALLHAAREGTLETVQV